MRRFSELPTIKPDYTRIVTCIESIADLYILSRESIDKDFEITEEQYNILLTDIQYAKDYTKSFGYSLVIFYNKAMYDKKYFIKFSLQ